MALNAVTVDHRLILEWYNAHETPELTVLLILTVHQCCS